MQHLKVLNVYPGGSQKGLRRYPGGIYGGGNGMIEMSLEELNFSGICHEYFLFVYIHDIYLILNIYVRS